MFRYNLNHWFIKGLKPQTQYQNWSVCSFNYVQPDCGSTMVMT
jgi:hypothetical protein